MKEFDIIRRLARTVVRHPDTVLGIGDDAALLRPFAPHTELAECCAIISLNASARPADAMSRFESALERLTERLSSARYTPGWLLLSICLENPETGDIDALEQCISSCCRRHNIHLIGGDISRGHPHITLRMVGKSVSNGA